MSLISVSAGSLNKGEVEYEKLFVENPNGSGVVIKSASETLAERPNSGFEMEPLDQVVDVIVLVMALSSDPFLNMSEENIELDLPPNVADLALVEKLNDGDGNGSGESKLW